MLTRNHELEDLWNLWELMIIIGIATYPASARHHIVELFNTVFFIWEFQAIWRPSSLGVVLQLVFIIQGRENTTLDSLALTISYHAAYKSNDVCILTASVTLAFMLDKSHVLGEYDASNGASLSCFYDLAV